MNKTAVDKLNRLLAAEYASLVHRLAEADPYVAWTSADDRALVERMAADEKAHIQALSDLIFDLRGAPVPPSYPTEVSGIHYLQLDYLMPQIIAGKRRLVAAYEAAGATGDARADGLVRRHLADHQRHLSELLKLHSNLAASQ